MSSQAHIEVGGAWMRQEGGSRLSWEQFVDRAFWGLLVAVAAYIASQAHSMNTNIEKLNEKMGSVMANQADQEKRLDHHDRQIQELWKLIYRGRSPAVE